VACGSSSPRMPTFPQWEAAVLDHCYDTVDYISLHNYFKNTADDLPTFLAESLGMDSFIRTVTSTADYVKAKRRSGKVINISFDEWNVWYHSEEADRTVAPWIVGPPLLEDVYTFEDALVVGCSLITLLRNAERVRIACLAQLVNTIAPIMTENGGPAWRQTIFYPFLHASLYGRGKVLETRIRSPLYSNGTYGDVPYLESIATAAEEDGEIAIFAVNRSWSDAMELRVTLLDFGKCALIEHVQMTSDDIKAANTRRDPDRVVPRPAKGALIDGGVLTATLPALSWNVIRVKTGGRGQS
jgi:alpha-N-arabinofuranosidase